MFGFLSLRAYKEDERDGISYLFSTINFGEYGKKGTLSFALLPARKRTRKGGKTETEVGRYGVKDWFGS